MRGGKGKKNIAQVILNHRQIKKKQEISEFSHAVIENEKTYLSNYNRRCP